MQRTYYRQAASAGPLACLPRVGGGGVWTRWLFWPVRARRERGGNCPCGALGAGVLANCRASRFFINIIVVVVVVFKMAANSFGWLLGTPLLSTLSNAAPLLRPLRVLQADPVHACGVDAGGVYTCWG